MPVNSSRFNLNFALLSLFMSAINPASAGLPELSPAQQRWLGDRVFDNECNRRPECLTSWNIGENFPSLGIGHFIWFQAGQAEPFTETFPDLLAYYRKQGVTLPDWLDRLPGSDSPWPDRPSFLAEQEGDRLLELREFLLDTTDVQVGFMIQRLAASLPELVAALPADEQIPVRQLLDRIANSDPPYGIFALVDYVNFKGPGTAEQERYAGSGWGLLQVVQAMRDSPGQGTLLEQFSAAAAQVLARRVANAPPERNEARWLAGWHKRVAAYIPPR